jgi:Stress up-regulated Nod 19
MLALVAGLFVSTWGVGTSGAQEHHGGHHGGHDHHGTTTTGPTTTTTRPTTTTTRPGTTTTTRPGTTTTTGPTTTTTRPGSTTTTIPSQPGAQVSNVRYGPFNIPGAPNNPDGTHGHAHTGNQFRFFVQKPCNDCYITSMKADLIYPDGRRAGYSTNAQLHHMVLASWTNRQDATCYFGFPFPLGLMFGQRFFASGDERTDIRMPPGYGYRVNSTDIWNLIYELAGMQAEAQNVMINMRFEWVPASTPGMTNVEPIWMDVAQCGFSTIRRPAGRSQASWTWNVNRPGGVMAIGGHIHDGGENITIRNDSTGQLICDSRAGYGESPLYVDHHGEGHISSMSTCTGRRGAPVARVSNGQRVTMTANYNMPAAVDDQMGIVMAFIANE